MSCTVHGPIKFKKETDREGHRSYDVDFLVRSDDIQDIVAQASVAAGLPLVGASYAYGNDFDDWALCTPEDTVEPVLVNEKGHWFIVSKKFTTKPFKRCQDNSIENPLLEPYRIGGSFINYSEEAYFDRFGRPFMSSSFEMYQGAEVEFDAGRPTITIGFNTSEMPVPVFAPIVHIVNDNWLWGLPPRTIKLSALRWQRLIFGTCGMYYSIDYDFEVKYDTWDRYIPDMGTRHLKPGGDPEKIDDYVAYLDKKLEPSTCFLNGAGVLATQLSQVKVWKFEKYQQGNLLLLGIPSDLYGI